MKFDLYDSTGKKTGSVEGRSEMFEAKVNSDLIHRAVIMQQANARQPLAHALTRGEVSMTTAKAFRQKGTGHARRGSKSTNLLRGGGVTHGPRNTQNFSKAMPRKERRAALFACLSSKAKAKEIFSLESFEEHEPKTKKFVELLKALPKGKRYLFVLPEKQAGLERSAANVPTVKTVLASYLNPFDVLKAEQVCILRDAFPVLEKTFLSAK